MAAVTMQVSAKTDVGRARATNEDAYSVTDLATGRVHPLVPGTIYALDSHDRHRLQAFSEVRIICTFSPALIGGEEHRADGSYPAAKPAAASRRPVAAKVKSRIGRAQKPGAKPKARVRKRGRR